MNKLWNTFQDHEKKFQDEPFRRDDTFTLLDYPDVIWPLADEYRIVEGGSNLPGRFTLQALYKEKWINVLTYDDGVREGRKVYSARWINLSDFFGWSMEALERIAHEVLGIVAPVNVVRHYKRKD